jgi:hypothetical protein
MSAHSVRNFAMSNLQVAISSLFDNDIISVSILFVAFKRTMRLVEETS